MNWSLSFTFTVSAFIAILAHGEWAAYAQMPSVTLDCSRYAEAVTGGSSAESQASAPAVPDTLLADLTVALPCLVKSIESLKDEVTSPLLPPAVRGKFLRATGAVRTILANNSSDEKLREVVKVFRRYQTPNVASVLSFGARSDNYDARLNSILILANVIDNSTVCVPLDHLYDPQITPNGRANLLGVVSVVAPWAYRENYDNIEITRNFILQRTKDDTTLKQTNDILENIKVRLASQSDDSNKGERLSDANACRKYRLIWAGNNLKY